MADYREENCEESNEKSYSVIEKLEDNSENSSVGALGKDVASTIAEHYTEDACEIDANDMRLQNVSGSATGLQNDGNDIGTDDMCDHLIQTPQNELRGDSIGTDTPHRQSESGNYCQHASDSCEPLHEASDVETNTDSSISSRNFNCDTANNVDSSEFCDAVTTRLSNKISDTCLLDETGQKVDDDSDMLLNELENELNTVSHETLSTGGHCTEDKTSTNLSVNSSSVTNVNPSLVQHSSENASQVLSENSQPLSPDGYDSVSAIKGYADVDSSENTSEADLTSSSGNSSHEQSPFKLPSNEHHMDTNSNKDSVAKNENEEIIVDKRTNLKVQEETVVMPGVTEQSYDSRESNGPANLNQEGCENLNTRDRTSPVDHSQEHSELKRNYDTLQKLYTEKEIEIKRSREEKELVCRSLQNALREKDSVEERAKQAVKKAHSRLEQQIASVTQLENQLSSEKQDHDNTKAKLIAHDTAAKKTIQQIQHDLQTKLAETSRACEDCKREKEGMVVKYAMAEQKNIEMEERMAKNNKRMVDMEKETTLAVNKFKSIRAERAKLEEIIAQRNGEIVSLRREIERTMEGKQEQELKTRWHQNKLKCEQDAHKETKSKLDEANRRLKQAQSDAEGIKREFQQMIKQFQETEGAKNSEIAMKSQEANDQREETEGAKNSEIAMKSQEANDKREIHSLVRSELETLKSRHKDMIEELRTAKDKVTCLEAERIHQEETLTRFKDTLQQQKQGNKELYDKLAALENIEQKLCIEQEKVKTSSQRVAEFEELNAELRADMEACSQREAEHLALTRRLTDSNAHLQAESSQLHARLQAVRRELSELQIKHQALETTATQTAAELKEEKEHRITETGSLSTRLKEKTKQANQLSQQLEDQKDETRTLRKRHQASLKDLQRQLQQAQRKLEKSSLNGDVSIDLQRQLQQAQRKLEKSSLNGDVSSMGSRTSSCNSLNTLGTSEQPAPCPAPPIKEDSPEADAPLVQFVEVDKQVLVEKIVRLQKAHARKNEKIEFMEEHINQLVGELQKKAKLIQSYVMREETGALASESMDLNKAQLSKKSGIMASVYNHSSRDEHMTLDLSLQINHKLQAVLEDTLLKNITLKDNMDTLGNEIATLSKENRDLQLRLQATGKMPGKT